jgi:hypothetical protein
LTKTAPTAEERRRRVRALLERLSPGTLGFIDSAKRTFPSAKLTALEVTDHDGTLHAITGKTDLPKETT